MTRTNCYNRDNLYILQGVSNIFNKRLLFPQTIEYILNLIDSKFDLIIIDAGSNIELGTTIGSLSWSKKNYIITTPQQKSLNQWGISKNILNKLGIDNFTYILNKNIENHSVDVKNLYETNKYFPVSYSPYGWQCEEEKKSLLNFESVRFIREIDEIIKNIAIEYNFEYNLKEKKANIFTRIMKERKERKNA